jgi:hypothetical protein
MNRKIVLVSAAVFFALLLAACSSIESIVINSPPARTVYGQGQDIDISGLVVTGLTKKGEARAVNVTKSQISGYDKHRVGDQTVVVKVSGAQATFNVTVVPLMSINLVSPPTKRAYRQGIDKFDTTGLVVSATWADPIGTGYYPVESLTISGFNNATLGTQTIILSAEGRSASFTVDVNALQNIAIQVPPTKTIYKVGEELDLKGMVVEGTWEGIGSSVITVSKSNCSGYEKSRAGQQTVTVTAGGKTAAFKVLTVGLSSIRIVAPPVKSRYMKGESLVLTGLEVWGTWEGIGSEKLTIPAENVTGFDSTSLGVKTLTVRMEEKTATFNISVMGLSTMRILNYPKITYYAGEALDLTGILVMGNYTDTITTVEQNIPVTVANVSGYLPTRLGVQTLTIAVDNVYTTFPVTVSAAPVDTGASVQTPATPAKTLVSIAIDYQQVTKWVYVLGESFDTSTVPIIGWYSDGTWANLKLSSLSDVSYSGFDSRSLGFKDVIIKVGSLQTFPLRVTVAQSGWDKAVSVN